jgi:hypothetical protein
MVWAIFRKPLMNDTYNTTFFKNIFCKPRDIEVERKFSPARYNTSKRLVLWSFGKNQMYNSRTQGKLVPLDLRMSWSWHVKDHNSSSNESWWVRRGRWWPVTRHHFHYLTILYTWFIDSKLHLFINIAAIYTVILTYP